MVCQFERLLFPSSMETVDAGSYMVAVYRPCEKLLDSLGNRMQRITAVGYGLPTTNRISYDMQGQWCKNAKHGVQFKVENYSEVITPDRDGIIAYLSCGQIKGIGPKIAEKIYAAFGNDTLEILDKDPERLLSVSGIIANKLKRICESYMANRAARDIVAFLVPYGITANRAVKLFREYGSRTMQVVKEHPYTLCEMVGVGFLTADKIARSTGVSELAADRVDAALIYTLTEAEGRGNLCMEKHEFITACSKLLQTPMLTEEMIANRAMHLVHSGKLSCYKGMVYRYETAIAETCLATFIAKKAREKINGEYSDIETELDKEEAALGLKLAAEQRNAVKTALTNGLTVITGGPGTGKTMIQRARLDIYAGSSTQLYRTYSRQRASDHRR